MYHSFPLTPDTQEIKLLYGASREQVRPSALSLFVPTVSADTPLKWPSGWAHWGVRVPLLEITARASAQYLT